MTARWLTGAILFVLGFGSALLLRLPAADAAVKEETVEGTTLRYSNGEDFRLQVPAGGKTDYLIAVVRKAGTPAAQPQISYKIGEAVFSKKDLESLTVFEVKPLIRLQSQAKPVRASQSQVKAAVSASGFGVLRCWHPQVYCPLPPPPDPPIRVSFTSFKAPSSRPR
jgi:hypothetical protein